ncbi:MAG: alpha/beta hydrolase [Lachnospiraceae bacterium]|nr:alpha/beta hydrolase [Lachnospiraceae bacterium]
MKKEEFYYDSRDGETSVHGVRWMPDNAESEAKGIIQIIHGMEEYVSRYEDFARFMTSRGFIVTGEDHLGHGGTVSEGGTQGYFCEQDPATVIVRDVHRLKKITQEKYPGLPVIIMGHSMGSFIARNYIYRYGTGINMAVIMGTGSMGSSTLNFGMMLAKMTSAFKGSKCKATMIANMGFKGYFKKIPSPKTEYDWLSANEQNVADYIADPMCGFGFTANGYLTLFELMKRMQNSDNIEAIPKDLPLLFVSGEDDPVGNYGEGVKTAVNSYKGAGIRDITMKLYPGDRHEILNEDDKETVKEDILEWITARLT